MEQKPGIAASECGRHGVELMIHRVVCVATVILATVTSVSAAEPYRPGGVNVTRWARGEIEHRNTDTGKVTGGETWNVTVHPDGSRTVNATDHADPIGHMYTVVMRVGADFQPREAFVQNWSNGVFRNASLFLVKDGVIDVTTRFAETISRETVKIPERFSFIPHPLATNVWPGWYYDKVKGGIQTITVYDIAAGTKGPMRSGQVKTHGLEYLGQEDVTVPAGTFPCDHFRIDDIVDYYVTGPDALFVKFIWKSARTEYVLTALEQSR
jgi:hypothetical protein